MTEHIDLDKIMEINCVDVSHKIQDFIKKKIDENGHEGVCIEISGGIDSAVYASVAAEAVGDPTMVHGLHLYDRDSSKKFRDRAANLAVKLGVKYDVQDISPIVKSHGTYQPLIMKLVPYSNLVNWMILLSNKLMSPILYGDSPFEVTLKRRDPSKMRLGFVAAIAKTIEDGFNVRHIERRRIIEEYAEKNNLLLVGAANRSESFVGWFVKDGIDDLPIELLLDLYKGQVRQMAEHYDISRDILDEKPSPDMFKGIGDEDIIGHKYETIDKVAYVVEHGFEPAIAYSNGVSRADYERIVTLNELSKWKRENPHEHPKLD
jgi:NAD+ synthase